MSSRKRSARRPGGGFGLPNDWMCGYAAALAALVRVHDLPSVAAGILSADGITLDDLRVARVERFDMAQLRKCFDTGKEPTT